MNTLFSYRFLFLCFVFASCNNPKDNDYSAYFGGEIINPKDKWVLFYQGENLLDSILLDQNNRFFIRFDSLASGLYTFKHEPEYQYVYFDKNDSIMVRINTLDFDESLVFCGRGEEKNNFLVEMYLKNQKDRNDTFYTFDLKTNEFAKKADSSYQQILDFYQEKKKEMLWSDDFDLFARAIADYSYYAKKEFYPIAYKRRSQEKEFPQLSKEFYNYRKNIDFNNENLSDFSPYLRYITSLVDNLILLKTPDLDEQKTALAKLQTTDSLIENAYLKNKVVNNIAFMYLMQDEKNAADTTFLNEYLKVSTDKDKKGKIEKMTAAIREITAGGFPEIKLRNTENELISSGNLFKRKTVVYFWSKKTENHFFAVHKKINNLAENQNNVNFIAICLDKNFEDWKSFLAKHKNILHQRIQHYNVSDLEELKDKWVVTRITRASVVGKNGKAEKIFANIFEPVFEKSLETIQE